MATEKKRSILFTVIATCENTGGKKRLGIKSPAHYLQQVSKLKEGESYAISVEGFTASRSRNQLAYHWILLGYLAEYSGHETAELHDAIMRQKFGVKQIVLGGLKQSVRRSIAEVAKFSKADMSELIETDLKLCHDLGIKIPTAEELGYLPS